MRKFLIISVLTIACVTLICIGLYKLHFSNKAPEVDTANIDAVKLFMSDVTNLSKNTSQIENDKINCNNKV